MEVKEEIKLGYKKTKLGWIPEDWKLMSIDEITDRITNRVEVEPDEEYQEIGIRSHGKGVFHKDKVTGKSLGNKRVFWIEPDCFVVNIVFAWEQAVSKTTEKEVGMIASHRFPMYKPKEGILELDYLLYFFKTPLGKYLLGLASPGGAGRNKTLGQKEFGKLKIPLPVLSTQNNIVTLLKNWDKAFLLVKELENNKRKLRRTILNNLYEKVKAEKTNEVEGLKKLTERFCNGFTYDTKSNDGLPISRIETISKGVVDFKKTGRVKSNGISSEYLLQKGDILFSHINSLKQLGKVAFFNSEKILYHGMNLLLIRANSIVIPKYLYYWFYTNDARKHIQKFAKRAINQSSISISDLKNFNIPIPSIKEQERVVNILESIDEEIKLLNEKGMNFLNQKRGLTQQLFTGKTQIKF